MLNVLIAGVYFGLAYIAGSIISTEVRKKENKQKRGMNMVAFVFLVATSISLFVLAFISAKYAFRNLRGKKNYVVELFLSSIFVTILGIYLFSIAMTTTPITSDSETVSDIKVFSKKDATCIIVYDGEIISDFDTKILPVANDSEEYKLIIDRNYSKTGKIVSNKYTLLVPKEITLLEQRTEDRKND